MVLDKWPFGTQEDVYRDEAIQWTHHSVAPKVHADESFESPSAIRIAPALLGVGFNISAMVSRPALSPNAVRALNAGAKRANSPTTPVKAA